VKTSDETAGASCACLSSFSRNRLRGTRSATIEPKADVPARGCNRNHGHTHPQVPLGKSEVPQKHCACARPKTAAHCPKSAAMAPDAPPSYRVSQVNVNRTGKAKRIFSVGQKPPPRTWLVQQTDQVATSRDTYSLGISALYEPFECVKIH
jgi:hypothetical protein